MLKHPSDPHTPSPLPSPSTPKPWGDLRFSDCQRSLHHLASPWLLHQSPLRFRGGVLGDHGAPRCLPGLEESQEGPRQSGRKPRIHSGTCVNPPCDRAGWERLLCSLCNCVAEGLPLLVFVCHRGNCVGAGVGAGRKGLPILYQRCYICVMGWGGEGITGAIEVEAPHPQASKCSFLFKVFFYSLVFFFFFLADGDS